MEERGVRACAAPKLSEVERARGIKGVLSFALEGFLRAVGPESLGASWD